VNSARIILVGLICAVPAILLLDGLAIAGLVAAISAAGIAIVASTLRQGEAEFLLSIVRPLAAVAFIPALFMLFQVVPLKPGGLAHPIWQSAEQALGHPISGSISIDPGATVLAFGQYLTVLAVGLLAAAVAVDRERAEWILFALVIATALIALVMITHDLLGLQFLSETVPERAQARTCIALGIICSVAAGIRTFERHETGHLRPDRSPRTLTRTFVACMVALALCVIGLALDLTGNMTFAVAYGLGTFLAIIAIRRIGLGFWGCLAVLAVAVALAIALIATRSASSTDATLAFASNPPQALLSTTQHILADAPWVGTGAGTFSLLLPIYRDAGDPITGLMPPTTAAKIAVELGRPMLWAIVIAILVGIFALLRGALARGRDSFYPAAGASSLLLLLLFMFCDTGVLGMPVGICAAAIAGIAFAQRQSRTVT